MTRSMIILNGQEKWFYFRLFLSCTGPIFMEVYYETRQRSPECTATKAIFSQNDIRVRATDQWPYLFCFQGRNKYHDAAMWSHREFPLHIATTGTLCVPCLHMQEKLTFCLPWQLIKFSSLDLIHMVVRGLLKEHYCKTFVKIPKVR